jgi:hypothetical protein
MADAPGVGDFELDAGFAAAPPVLGGVEEPPATGTASPA